MKILMVVHSLPQGNAGGTENYTRQLCTALHKNHEITVLTRGEMFFDGPKSQIWKRSNNAFPVYAYFRHPHDHKSPEQEYWNPDRNDAFEKLLKQLKPDVIHFQHCLNLSMSLVSVASNFDIPVYFTLHDFWVICPNIIMTTHQNTPCTYFETADSCRLCMTRKFKAPRICFGNQSLYKLRRQRMIDALSECKKVLVLSDTIKKRLIKSGFSPENILPWMSGIDTSRLSCLDKSDTTPSTPVRFGYTGTLSSQKGVDVLLKAFSSLPEAISHKAELKIYGDLKADIETDRRVSKWRKRYNHPSIKFMGAYSPADLPAVHSNLDVIVVPSTWYENRPLSILESFAAGNPVVCSNLGGMAELVETTGAGWTFVPGDHKDLCKVLHSVITNPDTVSKFRQNIPHVRSVDEEVIMLEKLYLEG